MSWSAPAWTICVAKPISVQGKVKRAFTSVGVGWNSAKGGIKVALDITIILSPNDEVYLFPALKVPETLDE